MKKNKRIYHDIARKTGLSEESVEFALSKAISETVKELLEPSYVAIDMIDRQAVATYVAGENFDLSMAETFESDILPSDPFSLEYTFDIFSPRMVKRIGHIFQILLSEMKWQENWKRWKSQTGNIVEGIIGSLHNSYIDIEFPGGQKAKFFKSYWVPKETAYYESGKPMFFYVLKVTPNPTQVFLSRATLRLPALLLKHHLPVFKFTCHKRYIGHKSFITTNAPKNKKLREVCDLVSQELNGEILSLMPHK